MAISRRRAKTVKRIGFSASEYVCGWNGGVGHIQLDVAGKLSVMTVIAEIVRAGQLHRAERGENVSRTHLPVARLLSAGTSQEPVFRVRWIVPQQLIQGGRSGAQHRAAERRFEGFQIDPATVASAAQEPVDKLIYFA